MVITALKARRLTNKCDELNRTMALIYHTAAEGKSYTITPTLTLETEDILKDLGYLVTKSTEVQAATIAW